MDNSQLASFLHEIRTPIQTILGTAELIKNTSLDNEQQEYIRQIAFSADILHTLVNDILDFEKIRNGKLLIESVPCNIKSITEQVLDLISIEAFNKGLELADFFDAKVPENIYGDPVRILQILLNIVKNAVKFTSAGYVAVKVEVAENTFAKELVFRIFDTGIGIPDNCKQAIFCEYVQEDTSTARKYGGTGLGLAICSNLVSLMKGTIGTRDNPEGGSEFYFTLPLHPVENEVHVPLQNFQAKVLVIDDSSIFLESMVEKLKSLGISSVHTAKSGPEALQKMEDACDYNEAFDLVFIDMSMPVMDGWRLAATINANKKINGTKLYLIVPEGQLGGEAKMKMLSWFNGYLYKPVKFNKLHDLILDAMQMPLELPAAEESLKLEHPKQKEQETKTDATVLAVDDHPVNLKIMEKFLHDLGCNVVTAKCGLEAVEKAKKQKGISIIFMDIQMPDINGTEAAQKIRQEGFKGQIIACSANPDPKAEQEYKDCGMNGILVKPFKKQQLQDLIKNLEAKATE